jgi:hypothetical protein
MSERDNNSQGKRGKTSKLAVASAALAGLGLCVLLLVIFLSYLELWPASSIELVADILFVPILACAGLGLALGIVALVRIGHSYGGLVGEKLGVFAVAVGVLVSAYGLSYIGLSLKYGKASQMWVTRCQANLQVLSQTMRLYANEHRGEHPMADQWCDLLIEGNYVTEDQFLCFQAGDTGPCHYAMNPTCDANSPGDVVLLFETTGGWNQYGGPEILTTENHEGKGCNVLFKDGSVRFVKTEELGMLRWKAEKTEE